MLVQSVTSVQKPTAAFRATGATQRRPHARMVVRAATIAAEDVPSPEKRGLMNLLLLGAIGAPVREENLVELEWITRMGSQRGADSVLDDGQSKRVTCL